MVSETLSRVLITGAGRGLGLALANHFVHQGWEVIATCRQSSEALSELQSRHGIRVESLDIADPASIAALAARLHGIAIDVLLSSASIVQDDPDPTTPPNADAFMDILRVNALSPILVARSLLDNVTLSNRRVIANVSSRLGSIGLNDHGEQLIYGASMAALNRLTVSLSSSTRAHQITVVALHPGWVSTGVGGADAPVTPAVSAAGLYRVIDTVCAEQSGRFYDYTGEALDW
ncbi:MAG: short-chain dehydrogenase [Thiotrichales bacterium]|nr:short-chain dehydrogenase [Thiotrichales bacterium]|tara:strand:+ start:462 stop:1160 length:699 start_codon:yes stop_codon:yes gene_type:complete